MDYQTALTLDFALAAYLTGGLTSSTSRSARLKPTTKIALTLLGTTGTSAYLCKCETTFTGHIIYYIMILFLD
jgi:hypothetical protein